MNKSAFTLIELLAVVVIIAIIALIGIPAVTKVINKSRDNSLQATTINIRDAIKKDILSNPDLYDQLTTIVEVADKDDVNYRPGIFEISKDPWGKNFKNIYAQVTRAGDSYSIKIFINTEEKSYVLESGSDKLDLNSAIAITNTSLVGESCAFSISFSIDKTENIEITDIETNVYDDSNALVPITVSLTKTENGTNYDYSANGVNLGTWATFKIEVLINKSGKTGNFTDTVVATPCI